MIWAKLNVLVPDPQCTINGEEIIEWNDTRPQPSQSEIDAVTSAQISEVHKDTQADPSRIDPWLKAYALCLNDGTIVPGSNMTPAQLKAAVKAKL